AVFDDDGAAPVVAQERLLVRGKDVGWLLAANHVNRRAHRPDRVGEVADVLHVRMEWPLRADPGADDRSGTLAATRHRRCLVEVVHELVDREEHEVPPWELAHGHAPRKG